MVHSPLGGSVASRFIACPGSAKLIASIGAVAEDPMLEEYRERGTEAHRVASEALWTHGDAWEISTKLLDADDQIAVQVYLDYINARPDNAEWVEQLVEARSLHPALFGTADYMQYNAAECLLEIDDYKHGVGVVVAAVRNAQLMYYAFCALHQFLNCRRVKMTIVQPRGFHPDGAIRSWECSAEEIMEWGNTVLLPAMVKASAGSDERHPGSHCQFCPAKLHCSEALALFDECATDDEPTAAMTDARLAERFDRIQVVQFVRKAIETEVLRRQLLGHKIDTAKLVMQKVDRVFKEGAEVVFKDRYGAEAYNSPSLKSPAQMEKLTGGKDLVKHWAYTPQRGFVTARVDDKRKEVTPPSAADAFQQYATGVANADTKRNEGE